MKLLVLHGPNMNLYGIKSSREGKKITLDKINRYIRKYIRDKNVDIKIIQTHNESKIVSYLHSNRNKFDGMIFTPGIWCNSAHILKDTLDIIKLPIVMIHLSKNENSKLFDSENSFYNDEIFLSFKQSIDYYVSK